MRQGPCRSRKARFSTAAATMVTGIRNSISSVGSARTPATVSASVMEWPTVNAVTTHTAGFQSAGR